MRFTTCIHHLKRWIARQFCIREIEIAWDAGSPTDYVIREVWRSFCPIDIWGYRERKNTNSPKLRLKYHQMVELLAEAEGFVKDRTRK